MEPVPPHIRPEDEKVFRDVPLARMTFRTRWKLGAKILIAAQVVWLPVGLLFAAGEILERYAPTFAASTTWSVTVVVLILASLILIPLWAAGLFRGWVASTMAQRLIEETLPVPTLPSEATSARE